MNTLKAVNIPCTFGIRGDRKPPCIVFNYYSEPYANSTEGEELSKYRILLNLYCTGDYTSTLKEINLQMKNAGFIRVLTANAMYNDSLKCWNIPVEYTKVLESE